MPHELDVVADQAKGTFVLAQRPLQSFAGLDVEVSRGLVKNQEIARLKEEPSQPQAHFLAAAQHLDLLVDGLTGETEAGRARHCRNG
jgi:hypothetical protein